jgi:hypothetical protein
MSRQATAGGAGDRLVEAAIEPGQGEFATFGGDQHEVRVLEGGEPA